MRPLVSPRGAAALGLLALSLGALTWGALAPVPLLFFLAAVVSYGVDGLLGWIAPETPVLLSQSQMTVSVRFLGRELLGVLLWLRLGHPSRQDAALIVLALAAFHVLRAVYTEANARTARRQYGAIEWRGLDVKGELQGPPPVPAALPVDVRTQNRAYLHLDLLLMLGLLISWLADSRGPALIGCGLMVLAGLVLVLLAGRILLQQRRRPAGSALAERVHKALEAYQPQVAVYFSAAAMSTYALNVWLETIDRIPRRTVIFVREAVHLETLGATTTPVLVLPRAQDVERFCVPSIRVALYPTTVIKNNHMLRLEGIRHVFINHGDGDKAVTYSPLHRIFDEIWVAGQAGKDRYLRHGEGVRAEQIRLVGRPQLAHITRATGSPAAPLTVLYAPTWEGNFDDVDYSSVGPMAVGIVEQLLAMDPPIRLLFKPHPATGQRRADAASALVRIRELITATRAAGQEHELVAAGPEALYDAFNRCDVLVADVSSVVADFLASGKPYVVTNPNAADPDRLRATMPSTGGGRIVGPDLAGLTEAVREVIAGDPLSERRTELADYFLGARDGDPIAHFTDLVGASVDEATEWSDARLQRLLSVGAR